MADLQQLFENNRRWAQSVTASDAEFFSQLVQGQSPGYLWIGCSDSRVPPGHIVAANPGGIFVHRNIANLVVESDPSCASVLEYAVAHLKVPHVIICGHYNCGGLRAALDGHADGCVGQWLEPAVELIAKHRDTLDRISDDAQRWRKLCELNVIEQVANVCRTEPVQQAWRQRQPLAVHGLIYELADGLLKDMGIRVAAPQEVESVRERAVVTWS